MVMTVECPSCASTFPVDPRKVPEAGVNARCTRCSAVFRVERPPEEPEAEATATPEPATPGAASAPGAPALPTAPEEPSEAGTSAADTPADDVQARASVPGEPPASQADTESVVEPPEADIPDHGAAGHQEAHEPDDAVDAAPLPDDGGEPTVDGDWQAWAGPGPEAPPADEAEDDRGEGAAPRRSEEDGEGGEGITASTPLTGGESWESSRDAGITTEPPVDDEAGEGPTAPGPDTEMREDAKAEDWIHGSREEAPSTGSFDIVPREDPAADVSDGDDDASSGPTPAATTSGPDSETAGGITGFSFGRRDPADKARRLARVLVSDMIMYNPERHQRALEEGTLKEDFEDEIAKSWKEYVEQVGEEMARGTDYWRAALNDILAKGEPIF